MRLLLTIIALPLALIASFVRPILTVLGIMLLVSWGWAYINPGLVPAGMVSDIGLMCVGCYSTRFAGDFLQKLIDV